MTIKPYMKVWYRRRGQMRQATVVGSVNLNWIIRDIESGEEWLADDNKLRPVGDEPMLSQHSEMTGNEPMIGGKCH